MHYEGLLLGLERIDPIKYARMHKGTPLFFLAWLLFDIRSFEKALYFLDAAIADDVLRALEKPNISEEQRIQEWINLPGARFLKLDLEVIARRTVFKLRSILEQQFARFEGSSGLPRIYIDAWVTRFVEPLLRAERGRSVLSAFYVFLFEYEKRIREIKLRTGAQAGGSNHPFLNHLFLGGLVFESVLKLSYPRPASLEQMFNGNHAPRFRERFGIPVDVRIEVGINNLASFNNVAAGGGIVAAFQTTAQLRNATGHNLERDNIFNNTGVYETLFGQVVNAILYSVHVLYVSQIQRG